MKQLITLISLSIFTVSVLALDVLQIFGSLSINDEQEFSNAPFVVLEGEPSTLAEEGLGGYKVVLKAESNVDASYTIYSKIYNYTREGYTLLGTPSIKLEMNSPRTMSFQSEKAGLVSLQLEILEKAEVTQDLSNFGQPIRQPGH
jgi:hypothetical protein